MRSDARFRQHLGGFVLASLFSVVIAGEANAISHQNDYSTNLENYRICTGDDPLGTCTFANVSSPSSYYLENGTKGTLVHTSTGAVRLRIDSVKLDVKHDSMTCTQKTSFLCETTPGTACGSGKECTSGPKEGDCCTVNSNCDEFTCNNGPQQDLQCANDTDCDDLDNGADWNVVFRGNSAGAYFTGPGLTFKFQLWGDTDTGCMKYCPFKLGGSATTGSINTDSTGLWCGYSGSGNCTAIGPDAYHEVTIRDPQGRIFAVPSLGDAYIQTTIADGDPAKEGDCSLTSPNRPTPCP